MPDTSNLGDSQGVIGLLCTLVLGVLSWWNLRKGQNDTHELDADKAELERERFDHERAVQALQERDSVIGTLREEVARLTAARAADEERHERAAERMQTRFDTERRVCAREVRHMHEELMVAASAIRGEAERAAAQDAAHRGETHLRFDHGEEEK